MRVYKRTLNIEKFEKDFSSLIVSRDDEETIVNDVVARINVANADIVTFLKDVDEIEDEEVQKWCRCAAVAQMYNVKIRDIKQQNKWVLLIDFRHDMDEGPVYSTAVVSKYGEEIIQEGAILSIGPNSNYYTWGGWIVKSIKNGKYGFMSDYGELLIPCLFDNKYQHGTGESMFFCKNICFDLRVFGKRSDHEKELFEELLDHCENKMHDIIICRSKDGVFFELMANDDLSEVDPTAYQEALKEVKAFMSPFIVSREELKQIVGKRSCGYEICDGKCIIYECTEITDKRFMNHGFSEVELPDTLESIGERAFYECTNLKSIRIPKSVTHIGECAFGFCKNLESIVVEEGNQYYCSDGNCLLTRDGKTLICGCKTSKIPASVEHIGDGAFMGSGIIAIEIPSGVTNIEDDAFVACHLASIEIPDSVKDYSAFKKIVREIKDIFLPSGGPLQYGRFRESFVTPSFLHPSWAKREKQLRQRITLHVPNGTEEEYREDSFFGQFGDIVTI